MNALHVILQLLKQLPEWLKDGAVRAQTYEKALRTFRNSLDVHEVTAEIWMDRTLERLENELKSEMLLEPLAKSEYYQQLKDQDLTDLLTWPVEWDEIDTNQLQNLISEKLLQLKTFLAPLAIANAEEIGNKLDLILRGLVDIPAGLDFANASLMETYRAMKLEKLKSEVETLVRLIMQDPEETVSSAPTSEGGSEQTSETPQELAISQVLDQLPKGLPKMEEQIQASREENTSFDQLRQIILSVWPILHPLLPKEPGITPELMEQWLRELEPEAEAVLALYAAWQGSDQQEEDHKKAFLELWKLLEQVLKRWLPQLPLPDAANIADLWVEVRAVVALFRGMVEEAPSEASLRDRLQALLLMGRKVVVLLAPNTSLWEEDRLQQLSTSLAPEALTLWQTGSQLWNEPDRLDLWVILARTALAVIKKTMAAIQPDEPIPDLAGLETLLNELEPQFKTWEQTPRYRIPLAMHWLNDLCQRFIPKDHSLEVLARIIGKLNELVQWLVARGLWVPVTFRADFGVQTQSRQFDLPADIAAQMEAGARKQGPGRSPMQATNSVKQRQNTKPTAGNEHKQEAGANGSVTRAPLEEKPMVSDQASITQSITNTSDAKPVPVPMPMLEKREPDSLEAQLQNLAVAGVVQLPLAQQEQVQGVLDGSVLAPFQVFIEQIWETLQAKWDHYTGHEPRRPEVATLDAWVQWLLQEIKSLADALNEDVKALARASIKELSEILRLALDWLLTLRMPDSMVTDFWPEGKDTNVVCWVLGLVPGDVLLRINNVLK